MEGEEEGYGESTATDKGYNEQLMVVEKMKVYLWCSNMDMEKEKVNRVLECFDRIERVGL